jgi:hypothetical protein
VPGQQRYATTCPLFASMWSLAGIPHSWCRREAVFEAGLLASADVAPALRNREDQPLVPQDGQRAARGRARYLVGLGDLCFRDPAARRQLARADLAADDLRNLQVRRHWAGRVDLRHTMIVMARDQLLRA